MANIEREGHDIVLELSKAASASWRCISASASPLDGEQA